MLFKSILASAIFTFPLLLSAEYSKAEIDLIFDMSLEELMDVKVTTATKTSEKLSQAPSSMTVFDKKRIDRMGIENVYDLLNFVPGFQVTRDVDIIPEPSIHTRGVTSQNGYVLVLLNGFRFNEVAWSETTMYYNYIPTSNVKSVEIIRGPGSALYGSNAFLGVVNIITDDKQNSFSVETGSFNKQHTSFNYYKPFTLAKSFSLSLDYNKDKGEDYSINGKDPREYLNLYTKFTYNQTSLALNYTYQEINDFIHFNSPASSTNHSENSTFKAMLKHDVKISDKLNLNTMFSYSQYNLDTVGLFMQAPSENAHDMFIGPYTQSSRYDGDVNLEYKINEHHNLITGVAYRKEGVNYQGANTNFLSPDNFQIAPKESFYLGEIQKIKDVGQLKSLEKFINIHSLYAQYKGILSDEITTFIGLRYDGYSLGGNSLNPRASLIYSYTENTTFKLLYATAFRAPTNIELFANSPRSIGNPSLDPEKVETTELVLTRKLKNGKFDVTLFHTNLKDIIRTDRRNDPSGHFSNINEGQYSLNGIEGELMYIILDSLHLRATHTHIFSKIDPENYKDISSLTVNYAQQKYNINLNGIFRKQQDNVLANQNDYALVNTHIRYKFSNNLNLSFSIDNLLNESYSTYAPKLTVLNNAVVNRGRTWRIGIETQW